MVSSKYARSDNRKGDGGGKQTRSGWVKGFFILYLGFMYCDAYLICGRLAAIANIHCSAQNARLRIRVWPWAMSLAVTDADVLDRGVQLSS